MGDTQKWMVDFMENPTNMDDLGVPLFEGNLYLLHPLSL